MIAPDGVVALREERGLWLLVLWLPPLLTLLFLAIFGGGEPRRLPVGVVDLDHGAEARALVRHLAASPGLDPGHAYSSPGAAKAALQRGDILAMVVIPEAFGADLRAGLSPKVAAFHNSQFLLSGKFLSSSLTAAGQDFAVRAGVALRLGRGQPAPQVAATALPVRPHIKALYNPDMSYARFLVTAIAPAMWQILIVVATVLLLVWRLRRAPLPTAFGERCRTLWSLLWPVTALLWLQGLLMLVMFQGGLDWRPAGNVLWLVLGLGLMLLAVQAMALMILALSAEPLRALSLCAAYLAPAFAFMGVTFPRGDMVTLARVWGDLMPSTHYLQLQVAVADHGAPWSVLWPPLLILLLFLLPLPLSARALPERLEVSS